jgi:hypothetical protein
VQPGGWRPGAGRATVRTMSLSGLSGHQLEQEDRFGGLPDPEPGNRVECWSRHWYGGLNPLP